MIEISTRLEMPKSSGIYKMTNKANGKVYIGKSVDMHQRFIDYVGDIRKGKKRFILDAIRKYGWDGFKLEIIEIYPTRVDNNYLLDREAFWIKIYRATQRGIGYNLCEYSRDRGGIPLSEEHKRRIGSSNKKIKRIINPEARKKLVDGLRKVCKTREFKLNMVNKKRFKTILHQIDPVTLERVKTWDLLSEAADSLKMSLQGLLYYTETGKVHKGFLWEREKVNNF